MAVNLGNEQIQNDCIQPDNRCINSESEISDKWLNKLTKND